MKSRLFLAAAAAGLFCAQALAAAPAAAPAKAAAPAGPWAKVPALPTACYSSQDQWWEQNNAAIDAVSEDKSRQNDINGAVERKLTEAMSENPMAIAQAMQQAMLNDPQNAQKYMERMTQQGQQAQTEIPAQTEKQQKLEAESKTLVQQYEAALDKAMAPVTERVAALKKKMGMPMDAHIFGPDPAWPDWAWKEWPEILKLQDKGYVANCATWWSATGPIHAYMKRYKDYLVQERIPYEKKLGDEPRLENFKLLSVPTAGWRTTTDYEAADDYMRMASTIFRERQADPLCRAETYCK